METIEPRWRKSTYSGNGGADCVEVGHDSRAVVVRDTKNRHAGALRFAPAAWRKFANQVKRA